MTRGGAKRATRKYLRQICLKSGVHRWKGDKKVTCEVCSIPKP